MKRPDVYTSGRFYFPLALSVLTDATKRPAFGTESGVYLFGEIHQPSSTRPSTMAL